MLIITSDFESNVEFCFTFNVGSTLFQRWFTTLKLRWSDVELLAGFHTSQPTFQRWINVVSMLRINVEITLIRHWKWNKIRRRIFNVAQPWYNVSARRWNNVETTLHNDETTLHKVGTTLIQRCFNLASTLFKTVLNPFGLVIIMDLQIHK